MDYKKEYEQALDNFKKIKAANKDNKELVDFIEYKYPELKENEDERIRKELWEYFHNMQLSSDCDFSPSLTIDDILAWLEKQGNNMHLAKVGTDNEENVWNNAHDVRPKHLQKCLCYDKYMGGVHCYVYDDISKYWCKQATEVHDPDGDNHVCDYADYRVTMWMSIPSIPSYSSKKQGEQNPTDKVEPKFKVGDWIVQTGVGTFRIIEVCKTWYEVVDYSETHFSIAFSLESNCRLWSIQDAKEGDVLTTDTWTFIFKKYQDKSVYYHCADCTFNEFSISDTGNFDPNYVHPATKEQRDLLFQKIEGAGYEWDAEKKVLKRIKQKPTVLISKFSVGDKLISTKNPRLTYKVLEVGHINELGNPEYKVEIFTDGKSGILGKAYNIHYIECKKLDEWAKLVDQKQEWSEEDEKFFKTALWHISYSVSNGKRTDEHCDTTDWLKGVKERLKSLKEGVQPRQKWSEDDERHMNTIIDVVHGGTHLAYENELNWLKSIKERMKGA